jgi:hypothetical protein
MDLMTKYLAIAKKGKEPDDLADPYGKLSCCVNACDYTENVLRIFPRSKIVEIMRDRDGEIK